MRGFRSVILIKGVFGKINADFSLYYVILFICILYILYYYIIL